jgi:SAM-dependent methyltransferase
MDDARHRIDRFGDTARAILPGSEAWPAPLLEGGAFREACGLSEGDSQRLGAWADVLDRLGGLLLVSASLTIPPHHPEAERAARTAELFLEAAAERRAPQEAAILLDAAEVLLDEAIALLTAESEQRIRGIEGLVEGIPPSASRQALDPLGQAIAAVDSESAPIKDFQRRLSHCTALARWASSLLQSGAEGDSFPARWEKALGTWKAALQLSRLGTFLLPPGGEVDPLEDEWRTLSAPEQSMDRVNALYYRSRGGKIYQDFRTCASVSPRLAKVDAIAFKQRITRLVEEGRGLPGELRVLEVGIGDGSFAADFLDGVERLDRLGIGPRVYPRLRYVMIDLSASMLEAARENARLAIHRDRLRLIQSDAMSLREFGPFHFMRFHELFDDLPRTTILYVDGEGAPFEVRARVAIRRGAVLKFTDGSPADLRALSRALSRAGTSEVDRFHPDTLRAIDFQMDLVPVDLDSLPSGDLLGELAAPVRQAAFPVPVGGALFLESLLAALDPDFGVIRIFDYGIPELPAHQTYLKLGQVTRRYGGSATHNVNFPFLKAIAEHRGFNARLERAEAFIRRSTGEWVLGASSVVPLSGPMGYVPLSRGERAPFSLNRLKSFQRISEIAEKIEAPDSAGKDTAFEKHAAFEKYAAFITALRSEGLLPPGLIGHYNPFADGLLDNLALDLEFALCGVFRRLGLDATRAGEIWIDGGRGLERLNRCLAVLGFPQDEDWVSRILDSPRYRSFWVLEITPR